MQVRSYEEFSVCSTVMEPEAKGPVLISFTLLYLNSYFPFNYTNYILYTKRAPLTLSQVTFSAEISQMKKWQ